MEIISRAREPVRRSTIIPDYTARSAGRSSDKGPILNQAGRAFNSAPHVRSSPAPRARKGKNASPRPHQKPRAIYSLDEATGDFKESLVFSSSSFLLSTFCLNGYKAPRARLYSAILFASSRFVNWWWFGRVCWGRILMRLDFSDYKVLLSIELYDLSWRNDWCMEDGAWIYSHRTRSISWDFGETVMDIQITELLLWIFKKQHNDNAEFWFIRADDKCRQRHYSDGKCMVHFLKRRSIFVNGLDRYQSRLHRRK